MLFWLRLHAASTWEQGWHLIPWYTDSPEPESPIGRANLHRKRVEVQDCVGQEKEAWEAAERWNGRRRRSRYLSKSRFCGDSDSEVGEKRVSLTQATMDHLERDRTNICLLQKYLAGCPMATSTHQSLPLWPAVRQGTHETGRIARLWVQNCKHKSLK